MIAKSRARLLAVRVAAVCLSLLLSIVSNSSLSAATRWQRFVVPGTEVHGHQFGIIQSTGCQRLLWVRWSTDREDLAAYLDAAVDIEVNLHQQSWQLRPYLLSVNSDIPFLTIAVLSNITAPETLVQSLASSTDATVTILGPPAIRDLMDITEDSFDVAGLYVAVQDAQDGCGV